jgi:hypothetical protein
MPIALDDMSEYWKRYEVASGKATKNPNEVIGPPKGAGSGAGAATSGPPPAASTAPGKADSMKEEEAPKEDKLGKGVLVFKLPSGDEKVMKFTKSPLGMTFHKSMPVTVKGVAKGSHAEELSVQPGWVVMRVCGEDLSGKGVDEARQILVRMASELPKIML